MSERKVVDKSWGYEIWFENNELYCGKLLSVDQDKWSSNGKFHYHKLKDETFYVISGILNLDYIDSDGKKISIKLIEGESFRVTPYMKHRFSGATPGSCKFIEVSTTHSDDDSYRCYQDPVSDEWIEV